MTARPDRTGNPDPDMDEQKTVGATPWVRWLSGQRLQFVLLLAAYLAGALVPPALALPLLALAWGAAVLGLERLTDPRVFLAVMAPAFLLLGTLTCWPLIVTPLLRALHP